MLKENARIFALLARVLDAGVVAAAFALAYWLRFSADAFPAWGWARPHPGQVPLGDYALALPVVVATFLGALQAFGLYEPRRTHGPLDEAWSALKASLAAVVLLMAAAEVSRHYSRAFAGAFGVVAPLGLAATRASVRHALRSIRRRGWNVRRALVVGEGPLARELVEKVRANPWTGIEVVGVLGLDDGAFRTVREVAASSGVDHVLLAVPLERSPLLREIKALLDALPVDVSLVPDTAGFLPIRPSVAELDGLPVVAIRRAPAAGAGAILKRSLDLAGAAAGLLVLAPLLGAIALAVRLLEGGPVLYRQERVGWGGRPFVMLKFRSMVADAERSTGPVRTQRGDPRRTRLGTFLRRTSLDELPQLWNVLKGEMSLVGPRPERPEFVRELEKELPGYVLRQTVKAGMTGLAQVNGKRGDSSFAERLELDLDYVRRWSVWLDLEILALTFVRGFVNENAF